MLQTGSMAIRAAPCSADRELPRRPLPAPSVPRRDVVLSSALLLALPFLPPPARADLGKNSAVLRSLKELRQGRDVSAGRVGQRLASALGQVQRARRLAATGAVRDARGLLREGGMKSVRLDAAAAAVALPATSAGWRNTLLDAFDDALRVAERGGDSQAVDAAGAELEAALKMLVDATSAAADGLD
jgi:hypothetical protein